MIKNNLKFGLFLFVVLALINAGLYSIAANSIPGLKTLVTIFGIALTGIFVWGLQVIIDDINEVRYNRRFPVPDNLLIFPDAAR